MKMEIGRWQWCIVVNCVLIHYVLSKPFSLNKAIAAESQHKREIETIASQAKGIISERFPHNKAKPDLQKFRKDKATNVPKPFSLNKAIAAQTQQKKKIKTSATPQHKERISERFSLGKPNHELLDLRKIKRTESKSHRGRIVSPLTYKKKFEIKSPLKPKKLRYQYNSRYKRRNKFIEEELDSNELFNKKYIPLLRSLSYLFDNILNSESSESIEFNRYPRKRNPNVSEERNDVNCACVRDSDAETAESQPSETSITFTSASTEVSASFEALTTEAPSSTTNNTTTSHISSLRQHTNVPSLLTRDTPSVRRDNYGISEGSGPAFHASPEGNISRDHGNRKHHTRSAQSKFSSRSNEENTSGSSRDGADSSEFRRRVPDGHVIRSSAFESAFDKSEEYLEHEEPVGHIGRSIPEHKRQNKLETGGDQIFIPQSIRGFRGNISTNKISNNTKSVQSKEDSKEGLISVAYNSASDKRITDRNGSLTTENQETSATNEAVITIKDLSNPILLLQGSPKNKAKVTIIDGYSVARDKNGENKLSEKSIRLHS